MPMSDDQRTGARVNIGGNRGRFEPTIYSEKWQDEGWLTLSARESFSGYKPTFGGGLAQLTTADRQHNWYVKEDGDLEYEIILGSLPLSPVIDLDIDFPAGMAFEYQPPLNAFDYSSDPLIKFATETDAWDVNGNHRRHRPERMAGGYEVYWKKSNNQYQTGKVAEIHRPVLIDALGRRTYATVFIDTERKKLHITCPEKWLSRATFPVIVDPTIGYTSLGASLDDTNDFILASSFTAGSDGTTATATFYAGAKCSNPASSSTVVGGVFSNNAGAPNALLSTAAVISVPTSSGGVFYNATLTPPAFANGTVYHLAINNEAPTGGGNGQTYYSTSGGTNIHYKARNHANDLPATYGTADGTFGAGNRMSAYVDYTAGGGGSSIVPIIMAQRRMRL